MIQEFFNGKEPNRSINPDEVCLHSCTKSHSLIWIDGPVRLLAIEELLNHGLHLGNARRTTYKNDLVHTLLVNAAVTQALFDGAHGITEIIHVELFKPRAGQRARVINAIEKGIDLDGCLCGGGECALGSLALRTQAAQSSLFASEVLTTVFAFEVLHAEINNPVVEILTSQVS